MQLRFNNYYIKMINFSLLIGAIIYLYWNTFGYWTHTWLTNFHYKYVFIIPILLLYIIWEKRDLFKFTPINPSNSGFLVFLSGILLFVIGQAATAMITQQLSFFIIALGIIIYYFGFNILRLLLIPLAILIVMFPFWEYFQYPLQLFAAQSCTGILGLFSVPIYVEGHYIQLPNVRLAVDGSCSGIRYITAMVPIGLTMSCLYFDSFHKKISIILFTIIMPIMANILRIMIISIFAVNGNAVFVAGKAHSILGHIIFLLILLMLFCLTILFKPSRQKLAIEHGKKLTDQNYVKHTWLRGFTSYRNLFSILLLVLVPILVNIRLANQYSVPLLKDFEFFSFNLGGWKGENIAKDEWRPKIIGSCNNLSRSYKDNAGNEIKAFISYLPVQVQGREIIFYGNIIIPDKYKGAKKDVKIWNIDSQYSTFKLKTTLLKLNNETRPESLFIWYQNTNHYIHNKYVAKALMAIDSLLKGKSNGSVFILIFRPISSSEEGKEIRLSDFMEHFYEEIVKYIPS